MGVGGRAGREGWDGRAGWRGEGSKGCGASQPRLLQQTSGCFFLLSLQVYFQMYRVLPQALLPLLSNGDGARGALPLRVVDSFPVHLLEQRFKLREPVGCVEGLGTCAWETGAELWLGFGTACARSPNFSLDD